MARADQPMPGLLALTLRGQGPGEVLIIASFPPALGVGLLDERPRGASATPALSQLRHHVAGASVEAVEVSRRAVRVTLKRGDDSYLLLAAPAKPYGAWWLCAPNGSILVRSPGAPQEIPTEDGHLVPQSASKLRERGISTWEAHQAAYRGQLERVLQRQIKRLKNKRDAILGDLERAAAAEDLRERASLLLAHVHEIPAGATHFDAKRWGEDAGVVRIDLDPRKRPAELAQELFAKSKRLERGLEVAPQRLAAVEVELSALMHLREAQQGGPGALAAELEAMGIETTAPKERERKRKRTGTRTPYREFVTADGKTVLVGRSASDNDRLTLRVAKPHDLWLHARGVTGAHVVMPLDKTSSPTPEALVDAATLAAHFSDLRGEPIVDVLYTPRRFVRKRKGSAIGAVTLEREKVIVVRIEAPRLARLLQTERKSS